MSKIYVITSGIYSDYHIVTATTDYNLALKIKEKYDRYITNEDDVLCIEEYDDAEEMFLPFWYVPFDENGNVMGAYEREVDSRNRPEVCFSKGRVFAVDLFAKDYETAIKSAAERRAKALAEREGL